MITVSEWIAQIDHLRTENERLARGHWHGYLAPPEQGVAPMRGAFYLVRWKEPTVAVSHNDRAEVIRLACAIEEAL
jgi:hypothetical protein